MFDTGRADITGDYISNAESQGDNVAYSIAIIQPNQNSPASGLGVDEGQRYYFNFKLGGGVASDGAIRLWLLRKNATTGWASGGSSTQLVDADLDGTPGNLIGRLESAELLGSFDATTASDVLAGSVTIPDLQNDAEGSIIVENQSGAAFDATASIHKHDLVPLRAIGETS